MSWILGINASHNGSYCLLQDGKIRVAIQEERLVGVKRARIYGARRGLGLRYCMDASGINPSDISMIVLCCQRPASIEENDISLNPDLRGLSNIPHRVVSHHLAHAASTVATSGFEHAAIIVADGLGSSVVDLDAPSKAKIISSGSNDWEHLSLFRAHNNSISPIEIQATVQWIVKRPLGMWDFFSLGGMFTAVAEQIFGDMNAAGKVMGLAPYGQPVIPVNEFVEFYNDVLIFPNKVQCRFKNNARWPQQEREYCDLAASAQNALEYALLHIAIRLREKTGERNLCLAGGVALNSVANQRICAEAGYDQVFIIPAAEDSGVAVGAAYLGYWELGGDKRSPDRQIKTDSYGVTATAVDVETAIRRMPGINAEQPEDILESVVDRLIQGQICGWVQGGSELGPRALGHRSIICSPCASDTQNRLNAQIKFRESFRPFAPAILGDHAQDWFEFEGASIDSPFMLRVAPFRPERREQVPAVVHVDGTGRLQTLTPEDNVLFYALVERFYARTGVPILLNTSMNIQGEPIVETPEDALWCLLGTKLDFCVVHDWLVTKRVGFGNILDFIPRVIAEKYSLRLGVADYSLQSVLKGDDAVTVRVSTPWGKTDITLPLRLLPLLSLIDGKMNGYALRAALTDKAGAGRIDKDLLLLRRMRIIDFIEPDV